MSGSYERVLPATGPLALNRTGRRWGAVAHGVGLALGLTLCYFSNVPLLKLAGLALFGLLALQRVDLALLYVPLTAPLFLLQLRLPGLLPHAVPPHELALMVTSAAAIAAALPVFGGRAGGLAAMRGWIGRREVLERYAPELLLLIAGLLGILFTAPEAVARQDALRAFRWFIAEPLAFVALTRWAARSQAPSGEMTPIVHRLIAAFVLGGAAVGLWALAQFVGTLVAPQAFSQHLGLDFSGDVLNRLPRVTSVYTNPNNLGLYLGRVWPVAAALALSLYRARRRLALAYAAAALACLGGILVSFSRGAWLGAGAALMVLLLPWLRRRFRAWLLPGLLIGGVVLAAVGALMLGLRGSLAGGSANVRLLLWREALALLARHPFGVGLDQFYYYHNPAFGNTLIDPTLANSNDRNAHHPHTLLLELWLNVGPLGVIAVALLLTRVLRGAWMVLRHSAATPAGWRVLGALAALAAALVHGMVDTFYFWPDLAIAFWLLLLLLRYDTAGVSPPGNAQRPLTAPLFAPLGWLSPRRALRVARFALSRKTESFDVKERSIP